LAAAIKTAAPEVASCKYVLIMVEKKKLMYRERRGIDSAKEGRIIHNTESDSANLESRNKIRSQPIWEVLVGFYSST